MKHTYRDDEKIIKEQSPSILLKVFCLIFRKKIVKLIDYEKKVRFSFARFGCYCGKIHCNVYWFTKVGDCILNLDGTVDRDSESFHIYFWSFVE